MNDCVFHLLVAETGEHLASHFCSNATFAPGDLYFGRKERIKEYEEKFGEVDVKFIDKTELTAAAITSRNAKWYASQPKDQEF